jgi:protein-disulfide isomerase
MTEYSVMMTPAIVVDGKIKIEGKVPTENDIEKIIKEITYE